MPPPVQKPRLKLAEPTTNEQILDATIRRAIVLERIKAGVFRRVVGHLNQEVYPELLSKLDARLGRIASLGRDTGPRTTQRLKTLAQQLRPIVTEGYRGAARLWREDLVDLAFLDSNWATGSIKTAVPVSVSTIAPSSAQLRAIVDDRPFQGRILKEWASKLSADTVGRVSEQLRIGGALGETRDDLVRRIRGTKAAKFADGVLARSRREVETVVRTSVQHTSQFARAATYEANSDLVKSVRYVATLDTRTSPICRALDGQAFDIGKGPRPPMHHQCRSTTVPVIKSWEDLGINLKEAPPGTRASMDGQVPSAVSYEQWLRLQPKARQLEALGRGRFDAYKRGVPLSRMVDQRHRPLSVAELKGLDVGKPAAPRTVRPPTPAGKKRLEEIQARAKVRARQELVELQREQAARVKRHEAGRIDYMDHPNAPRGDFRVVKVDVSKVLRETAKDPVYHVARGSGGEIKGRIRRAREFVLGGSSPIQRPVATFTPGVPGSQISFTDGRHRFAALHELGVGSVEIHLERSLSASQLREFLARFGR